MQMRISQSANFPYPIEIPRNKVGRAKFLGALNIAHEDLGNLAGVLVEILRGANDVPLGRQCFIVFEGGINSSL